MVRRFGGVVDQTCAAAVGCAGQEGHPDRSLMSDSLESADEIGTLEILRSGFELAGGR